MIVLAALTLLCMRWITFQMRRHSIGSPRKATVQAAPTRRTIPTISSH
jgi:hypothetical protein